MTVNIVYDKDNRACGWEMTGENPEEIKKLGTIRDLQFWGFDDNAIEYNGRREGDVEKGNPGTLSWTQIRTHIKP